MKALRQFNFGDKLITKNATHVNDIPLADFFKENATKEQIDLLKKYKFICTVKKKSKKVDNGSLSENTK